jgi:hypothetical protein
MLRFAQLKQFLHRLVLLVMTDTPKEVVGLVHRSRISGRYTPLSEKAPTSAIAANRSIGLWQ